jgi:hypothetical protein
MNDIYDFRRQNLSNLVLQLGGLEKASQAMGKNHVFLSQMVSSELIRPVIDQTARSIEQNLGLAPLTLDAPIEIPPEVLAKVLASKEKRERSLRNRKLIKDDKTKEEMQKEFLEAAYLVGKTANEADPRINAEQFVYSIKSLLASNASSGMFQANARQPEIVSNNLTF